jgi:hypothetical protein
MSFFFSRLFFEKFPVFCIFLFDLEVRPINDLFRSHDCICLVVSLMVVTLSSDVVGYQRFGEPCCLHLQGEDSNVFRNVGPVIWLQGFTTWRWRQHGPSKRWCPTSSLHGVITWRWMQHGPPKRWYPTTSLPIPEASDLKSWLPWKPRISQRCIILFTYEKYFLFVYLCIYLFVNGFLFLPWR